MCVCVCVCVCEGRGGEGEETGRWRGGIDVWVWAIDTCADRSYCCWICSRFSLRKHHNFKNHRVQQLPLTYAPACHPPLPHPSLSLSLSLSLPPSLPTSMLHVASSQAQCGHLHRCSLCPPQTPKSPPERYQRVGNCAGRFRNRDKPDPAVDSSTLRDPT